MVKKKSKILFHIRTFVVAAFGISFLIPICVLNKKSEIKITEEIYTEEFKAEADSQQESVYPFNDSYIIRPEGWQISKQNRSWYTDGEKFY